MSHIYLGAIVNLLAVVLPALGVQVGSEALTITLQTLVLIGSALWILIRRVATGDITILGARK
jgi:hypothetical protein